MNFSTIWKKTSSYTLAETTLYVSDLLVATHFYLAQLGMRVLHERTGCWGERERIVGYSGAYGEGGVRLVQHTSDDDPAQASLGACQLHVSVPNVAAALERMTMPTTYGGPDGAHVEGATVLVPYAADTWGGDGDTRLLPRQLAAVCDPDGHVIHLLSPAEMCPDAVEAVDTSPPDDLSAYRLAATALRVTNHSKSLDFYQIVLGMRLISAMTFKEAKFAIYTLKSCAAPIPARWPMLARPRAPAPSFASRAWQNYGRGNTAGFG